MKIRWLAVLFAATTAGCSSDVYPISDILVEGISQQGNAVEYLYFQVPDGTECAGVRIRSDGTRRILSFIRSTSEVDSVAVVSKDFPWEGMLRVEIPIEDEKMAIVIEGGGESKELAGFSYHDGAQSNKPMRPNAPSGRR
jgi:hypothetical protein